MIWLTCEVSCGKQVQKRWLALSHPFYALLVVHIMIHILLAPSVFPQDNLRGLSHYPLLTTVVRKRGPSLAMMASARASAPPMLTLTSAAPADFCRVVLQDQKKGGARKRSRWKGRNMLSRVFTRHRKFTAAVYISILLTSIPLLLSGRFGFPLIAISQCKCLSVFAVHLYTFCIAFSHHLNLIITYFYTC